MLRARFRFITIACGIIITAVGIADPFPVGALTPTGVQYRQEVNRVRVSKRVPELRYSYTLGLVALKRGQDMAAARRFSHTIGGRTFQTYLSKQQVKFISSGEVLGLNYRSAAAGVAAWLGSSSHRAIVLNTQYTHVGAAVVKAVINGRPSTIVVVVFGRLR